MCLFSFPSNLLWAFILGLPLLAGCGSSGRSGGSGEEDDSAGDDDDSAVDDDETKVDDDGAAGDDDDANSVSEGCGKTAAHSAGGVQVTIDAGAAGAGQRGFWLTRPASYDPEQPSALVIGYPGTNWVGEWVVNYLDLESEGRGDEIFVYPDPLWWDFPGWGNLGGWLLGPHAYPANGDSDIVFTEALLDYMESEYCIDRDRVFVTGHSWGGDMAQVVSCFLGDRIRASIPVAANRPYWFEESNGSWSDCVGEPAVWTMFGEADDHFTSQSYPGEFGDEQRDFWIQERDCEGVNASFDLGWGQASECVEFEGCSAQTRYCLYGPASGHQVPSYYANLAKDYFRSF